MQVLALDVLSLRPSATLDVPTYEDEVSAALARYGMVHGGSVVVVSRSGRLPRQFFLLL